MESLHLYVGDKKKSSWSLRPWLFLKHHDLPFAETELALGTPAARAEILRHSPSGKVPVLHHGARRVWESLAICEYAAETFALPGAWPFDPAARALARSMAQEMATGFPDLRRELSFDALRKGLPVDASAAAQADIARVLSLWREARAMGRGQGDWLFGRFGIVDAMFAPVALRFSQYAVALKGAELEYQFAVLAHPAVQDWLAAAQPAKDGPLEATIERTTEVPLPTPTDVKVLPDEPLTVRSVMMPQD